MARPKLKYIIQCDEVRIENGKFSAVGMFDNIYSFIFPAAHKKFFLLIGFTGEPGMHSLDMQVTGPGGESLGNTHGQLKIENRDQTVNTVFAFENFPLPAEGRYTLSLFIDGDFLLEDFFTARPPVPRREKTSDEISKLLEQPDVIHSANADVSCTKCRGIYKFQLKLDPTADVDEGFMKMPPGEAFTCGQCGNIVPLTQVRQNLENIVGIPRAWLSPQSAGENAPQGQSPATNSSSEPDKA
jgi:hypothetical protein